MIWKSVQRARVLLVTMLFVVAACSGCEDDAPDVATDGGLADSDVRDDSGGDAAGDTLSCEPGEVLRCTGVDTPGVERCNAGGDGVEQSSCEASQVCRDGGCVDVTCIPDTRRCSDPTHTQQCNADGSAWEDVETCSEGETCEEGFCLDRCEMAERTSSYIGCEYLAVELENHMLDESGALSADQRPPFAIVLANTSDSYDAEVSIYTEEGQHAEAIGSRLVGTDNEFPGDEYVTVYSELLDADGNRRHGPITGAIDNLPLPRNTLMTLLLPHRSVPYGESTLDTLGYRVESSQPVVAYQFNPFCCNYNHTNDASLLLPTSALTENYMFTGFPPGRGQRGANSPTLTVVAAEPDTEVSVKLRAPRPANDGDESRPYTELIYPFDSSRVTGPDERGQINVTMQPFEVLNVAGAGLQPVEDLTGALVEASAPVAVFSGHTCTYVPFSLGACDHLESQLFPLETWGERFIAAPLKLRGEADGASREGTYWKFLAREDDTQIDVGTSLSFPNVLPPAGERVQPCQEFAADAESGVFELDAGQSCEFGTREVLVVEATYPIQLGAFLSGQKSVSDDADWGWHAGDPAFFLVPPDEQYRTDYSFLTPATYFQSYVTVTTRPGMPVTLDGEQIDLRDHDYEELPQRGVARAHIEVDPGPHHIEAPAPLGIVVYGYDDYVSYAYTGGLNFKKLSPWEQ